MTSRHPQRTRHPVLSPSGLLALSRSGLLGAALLLGCTAERAEQMTVALPLLAGSCARLQDPALGGSPMEGTLVKLTVAGQVPSTELLRGKHPCSPPTGDDGTVLELTVSVPAGKDRRLSVSVLGAALGDLGTTLPLDALDGLPASVASERVVFFDASAPVPADATRAGALDLALRPYVHLLGTVRDATGPLAGAPIAGATVRFFVPNQACVAAGAALSTTELTASAPASTSAQGRFFLKTPYQPGDGACVGQGHGTEGFAFIETADGRVALLAPGRAEEPGRGLEPGLVMRSALALPRTPSAAGVSSPVLTGLSHVPEAGRVVLYASGFGLLLTLPLQAELVAQDSGERQAVELRLQAAADPFGPFPSYAPFRRFGSSLPFIARGELYAGGTLLNPPAGAYWLRLVSGGGTPAEERIELPVFIGAAAP